jgi:hypothetical protein
VCLLVRTGRREEARALIGKAEQEWSREEKNFSTLSVITMGYTELGEYDKALEWLERGVVEMDGAGFAFARFLPFYDPLRSHPRFQALERKVGLEG